MQNIIRQSENHAQPPCIWLGEQAYTQFLKKMAQHAQSLTLRHADEVIWFCEHLPVYTTGKRGINNSKQYLSLPLITTERGGETTFHGTGQLMMYPIINLKERKLSVREYVYRLEQSCIELLATYNIQAKRDCGLPGVWIEHEKIAALGIRVSQGVVSHGIALNVHTDLTWFDQINPCGTSRKATNMLQQNTQLPSLQTLAKQWYQLFMLQLTAKKTSE